MITSTHRSLHVSALAALGLSRSKCSSGDNHGSVEKNVEGNPPCFMRLREKDFAEVSLETWLAVIDQAASLTAEHESNLIGSNDWSSSQ
jgi:hypothetical protein